MEVGSERLLIPADGNRPGRQAKHAQVIADELRALIVRSGQTGDYLPPERELIERYSVSRPTLREALRILETEGLVAIRRGARGGAIIREPSVEAMTRTFGVYLYQHGVTLRDIFDARIIIEPAAARLAASARRPDVSTLEAIVERERRSIADAASAVAETTAAVAETEVEFHKAVLDLSGNFTLASFGHLLEGVVSRHAAENQRLVVTRRRAEARDLLQSANRAHTLIVEAIRQREPDKAERRMLSHLRAALETMPLKPTDRADIFGRVPEAKT